MKSVELKVARIGNSRGVRIPAATLKRYQIEAEVIMEERSDGILLRPPGPATSRLSWEDTAREMAAEGEDWSSWDTTSADGLNHVPWEPTRSPRVADLDPTQGAEMAKTRPVVIVSLDVLNARLQTVTVCPLTTQLHPTWRSRLGVRVDRRNVEIAVDQIRTISKSRIRHRLATLSEDDARTLRRLITEMYGE